VATGTLTPGGTTVPRVTWREDIGGGRQAIFVSRLVNGGHSERGLIAPVSSGCTADPLSAYGSSWPSAGLRGGLRCRRKASQGCQPLPGGTTSQYRVNAQSDFRTFTGADRTFTTH
jgi:hypothetical protein